MNNTIKFKLWHKQSKQFVTQNTFGNYVAPIAMSSDFPTEMTLSFDEERFELIQCTNTMSIDNEEIWEMDILDCDTPFCSFKGEVVYREKGSFFITGIGKELSYLIRELGAEFKKKGNLFEYPHLINNDSTIALL